MKTAATVPLRFTADDTLFLTNLTKVFWPDEGYTKRHLLDYYREIASVIIPYLADRPQVLHRHVDGWDGKEFFQRVSRKCPPWVQIARIAVSGRRPRDFHLCQDWPTLLWMANFGCIEFIPWNSRMGTLDLPDYLVIDLDPGDVPFARVVETALAVRRVLDAAGAENYCKTSGKRGLHICVPLGCRYSHPQAKLFGEIVARIVHGKHPETTSLDPRPLRRQHQVYLDHSRNARGQALAAPYCARPYPGATVSAPLKWSEVSRKLDPSRYTICTMPARVEKLGDLWSPVLGEGIDLEECLARLREYVAR